MYLVFRLLCCLSFCVPDCSALLWLGPNHHNHLPDAFLCNNFVELKIYFGNNELNTEMEKFIFLPFRVNQEINTKICWSWPSMCVTNWIKVIVCKWTYILLNDLRAENSQVIKMMRAIS